MNHFYQNIYGWFDFADLYSKMVKSASNGSVFVELGCLFGKSTAYMAVEILNSGKDIYFDVVDIFNFRKVPDLKQFISDLKKDLVFDDEFFDLFKQNIKPAETAIRYIWKMDTVDAAMGYADESVDFVFIDGNHTYENIRADITAWLPKVASGGVLAGHDIGINGVKKAVDELLDWQKVSASCWYYRKD